MNPPTASRRSRSRRANGTSRPPIGWATASVVSTSRHGTLSLYAALETQTGVVIGKTAERHTSDEFVAFLEQIVSTQRRDREIHCGQPVGS